ncbi:hypothetical protein [Sphingobium sp. BS19]|uniref:hypothetical protein n=1 Tax=Sphingobium sp. BS19 TaxID=3018973 RepID=UPI0022EDA94F|nr:hypothetical protein [Sphingobium sp. BS19]GLI99619.1 hypothetical protein Sbs19_34370 [Sphingobium sp. BS19]
MIIPTILSAVMFIQAAATSAPQSPDSVKVTKISEAVEICHLSAAVGRWEQKDENTIALWIDQADLIPGSKLDAPLKQCFFPWAYDRNVKVEFNLNSSGGQ